MTESENLFDYYYSAKQAAVLKSKDMPVNKVRGQEYTEAIKTGQKITSTFDDLVCIARGVSMRECDFTKKTRAFKY